MVEWRNWSEKRKHKSMLQRRKSYLYLEGGVGWGGGVKIKKNVSGHFNDFLNFFPPLAANLDVHQTYHCCELAGICKNRFVYLWNYFRVCFL